MPGTGTDFKYNVVFQVFSAHADRDSGSTDVLREHLIARQFINTNDKGVIGIKLMDEMSKGNVVFSFTYDPMVYEWTEFDTRLGVFPSADNLPSSEDIVAVAERMIAHQEERENGPSGPTIN